MNYSVLRKGIKSKKYKDKVPMKNNINAAIDLVDEHMLSKDLKDIPFDILKTIEECAEATMAITAYWDGVEPHLDETFVYRDDSYAKQMRLKSVISIVEELTDVILAGYMSRYYIYTYIDGKKADTFIDEYYKNFKKSISKQETELRNGIVKPHGFVSQERLKKELITELGGFTIILSRLLSTDRTSAMTEFDETFAKILAYIEIAYTALHVNKSLSTAMMNIKVERMKERVEKFKKERAS